MWFATGCIVAQESSPADGARRMFYFGATAKKETLPPVATAASRHDSKPHVAVANLGLRYNLVLVSNRNRIMPVDSTRIFRSGECVAVELQSNRSGYLYVMAKQSDGNWTPLLPSPEMPDETNVLDPGMRVRVPKDYCFEIHNPPGKETLVVILSRDPRDFEKLYDTIRGASPTRPAPAQRRNDTVMANARLNEAAEDMSARFGDTRNLVIKRMAQPETPEEPPFAVYVVNRSSTPAATVATRIEIQHR
jgi:hypothetical protein